MFENYNLLRELASYLSTRMFYGVDTNGDVYVYIDRLDGLMKKSIHFTITGRGCTLENACYDYVKQLINPRIKLRFRYGYTEGYSTEPIHRFLMDRLYIYRIESKKSK